MCYTVGMIRKRWLSLLLLLPLLFSGCAARRERFSRTWYDAFDTVVTLTAYAADEAAFARGAEAFEAELFRLHAVFDRYAPHEGVQGLYALNAAGGEWVAVEPELYDLLGRLQAWGAGGAVEPALGGVIDLWTQARETGVLPDGEALAAAAAHADFAALELSGGRARLTDPETRLDLGASAKGYAAQLLRETAAAHFDAYLIDAGGNVVCGPAADGGVWRVGVAAPDGGDVLLTLGVADMSVVTSGDSQRYFTVDGARYHHILDPETLYPARNMRQATIVARDAGYADYLSTLLFLLPMEEALETAEALEGVEVFFIANDGTLQMTSGAKGLML